MKVSRFVKRGIVLARPSNIRFVKQVTRVMLLWVINHFNSDFEDSPSMEKHLERFEKGLEKHVRRC